MKKIFIILLSIATLSGCKDFLDMAPSGGQTKEYIFEDYTRAERYMDQLYTSSYLPYTWQNGYSLFHAGNKSGGFDFLESATDMAEYTATYGAANQSLNVGAWRTSWTTFEISTMWSRSYKSLRVAYMFLENMDSFNNEPEGRKTTMKGEAHFMIGLHYTELLKRYGGVPLVKQVYSLEDDMKLPRATYDETVAYIVENLDLAISELPDEWPQDNYGRATKAAAMALKSRVLLYAASPLNNSDNSQAKWRAAAEAARDCIDYCEGNGMHSLSKVYEDIFLRKYSENVPEIILPVRWGDNTVSFNNMLVYYGQATPASDYGGYGSNSPTQNFVDRFEVIKFNSSGDAVGTEKFNWNNPEHVANIYKNRDPRFYSIVLYNSVPWILRPMEMWQQGSEYGRDINPKNHLFTRTGYYLRKFWGREAESVFNRGSFRMFAFFIRYAEVLLNYAEAMNEAFGPNTDDLGRTTGTLTALDAVNRIRARLVCPPSSEIGTESDVYYRIKFERSKNPDFPVLRNGMPPIVTSNKDDARERIRNERAIELCFEGHYLYDVLRWKEGSTRFGGTIYGVTATRHDDGTFTYTRKVVEERPFDESRMYRYPIPNNQVYTMGIEQNPGW